jgi:hypothetical protein
MRTMTACCSEIYILKEYFFCNFTLYILFYSIIIYNFLYSSYSTFILYINYYLYFIIFSTTNFSSIILISIIILFYFIFHNSISNYPIIICSK